MKSVLINIKPKYCELIASGNKTIEVRKTRPKLETPFKCYIYCTSVKSMKLQEYVNAHQVTCGFIDDWSENVIGEFICDYIYENMSYDCEGSCVSVSEFQKYANGKPLYGWHISELKIYDKPKELSEFHKKDFEEAFSNWEDLFSIGTPKGCVVEYPPEPKEEDYILTRPPQSWYYVEENNEND